MKTCDEFLNSLKYNKTNIPQSFTETILNFSPDSVESRKWIMRFNIKKCVATIMATVAITSGVAFAGTKIYESIWIEPQKVDEVTTELTPAAKTENISEEDAKKIAIDELTQIGFNTNIIETAHYKEIDSDKIMYRFINEDNYKISIDGQEQDFFEIWYEGQHVGYEEFTISEEKGIEVANRYFELFGYEQNDYEITNIRRLTAFGDFSETGDSGIGYDITYTKKYGEEFNPYEKIYITVYAKDEMLSMLREENNNPFDDNPIEITEKEALNIALEFDKIVENREIASTNVEQMIVQMNADAYSRAKEKDKYYEAMTTVDYPMEKRVYYETAERIRNAWVVVITYVDNFDNVVDRYPKGQYSYFVDATTGEIIGGSNGDFITYR